MAALVDGGEGRCEPSVYIWNVFLYVVERRVRKRAFPWRGQSALVHGSGR